MRSCALLVAVVALSLAAHCAADTAGTCPGADPRIVQINFGGLFSGVNLGGVNSGQFCEQAPSSFQLQPVDVDQFVGTMPGRCPAGDRPGYIRWCAKPGGTVDVQVHVLNNGSSTWKATAVSMPIVENPVWPFDGLFTYNPLHTPLHPGWKGLKLSLVEDVQPGETAVFRGLGVAPPMPGIHTLFFRARGPCGPFGEQIALTVQVDCSDFLFCNGEERFVDGVGCIPAPVLPCNDGFDCTKDYCREHNRTCWFEVVDHDACETCDRQKCTPQCSTLNYCGEDRCGGVCPCSVGLACNNVQQCIDPSQVDGGCQKPFSIPGLETQGFVGTYNITVDNRDGVNQVVPTCNTGSYAPEIVYAVDIPADIPGGFVGVDIRLYDKELVLGSDLTSTLDTVLEVRESECLDYTYNATRSWCSDDSVPPGGSGSRVALRMLAGKRYYIIADSYSIDNVGVYTLQVRFTGDHVANCDAKFCGNDGFGMDCGPCAADEFCSATSNRCFPKQCTPNCDGKSCGPDGCDGSCGDCNGDAGELCVRSTGQCTVFPRCDHKLPVCAGGCNSTSFCANDCQCHDFSEEMPDYILLKDSAIDSLRIEQKYFDSQNCAVAENCIGGIGWRRVMRLTVEAINQGFGNLDLPLPTERPDMFVFSQCHGHYHYEGFALYELLKDNQTVVAKNILAARGHKQAYCLEDSYQYLQGPKFRCAGVHYCSEPGTSAGWSDFYGVDLDCQWVDITDLPAGEYTMRLEVNAARGLLEGSFDNNVVTFPVTIPEPSESERTDYAASRNKPFRPTAFPKSNTGESVEQP